MSKFKKIGISSNTVKHGVHIKMWKFQKVGTKRIFFAPEFEGKRLSNTMFQRRQEAEALANRFRLYQKELNKQKKK